MSLANLIKDSWLKIYEVKETMKKYRKLLLSLVAVSLITPTVVTDAQETDENLIQSNVNIQFTQSTDAPDIVDPDDPGTIVVPDDEEGTVTGDTGLLTLDFVSHFDFGTHVVDFEGATYNTETERPYIQVSDRRGTGGGWNVTAQLSNFSSENGPSLPGAVMNFNQGNVRSAYEEDLNAPTTLPFTLEAEGAQANVTTAAGKTVENDSTTAQGLGTWVTNWIGTAGNNGNVSLTIPQAAASPGNHTATITWTLTDGPDN